DPPLHALSDRDLTAALGRLGGTPPAVLAREEMLAALLPTLRADLELAETYAPPPHAAAPCPITAFGGSDDTIEPPKLRAWGAYTKGGFRLEMLTGGHFYLSSDAATLANEIVRDLIVTARPPIAKSTD